MAVLGCDLPANATPDLLHVHSGNRSYTRHVLHHEARSALLLVQKFGAGRREGGSPMLSGFYLEPGIQSLHCW